MSKLEQIKEHDEQMTALMSTVHKQLQEFKTSLVYAVSEIELEAVVPYESKDGEIQLQVVYRFPDLLFEFARDLVMQGKQMTLENPVKTK